MKENYTHISMILDRSGSMSSVAEDTIGGFNEFLKEQKKVDGEATVTLVQFDDHYEVLHDFTDIKEVNSLTSKTFIPRGMTALYDAVGKTVNSVGEKLKNMDEADRPEKVIVVILTDGMENKSREFTATALKDMIKEQTDSYSWEFVFIGANQDAILTGRELGIDADHSMTYTHNSVGTRNAFASVSKNMSEYRTSADFYSVKESDRKLQDEAKASV